MKNPLLSKRRGFVRTPPKLLLLLMLGEIWLLIAEPLINVIPNTYPFKPNKEQNDKTGNLVFVRLFKRFLRR